MYQFLAGDIRFDPPSNKTGFARSACTPPFVIIAVTVVLVVVGLSCLVLIMLFAKVDHRIFMAARNCSGDGFSALYYNKTDSSGHATLRFFKYKYMEDIQNDLMYNFNQVVF